MIYIVHVKQRETYQYTVEAKDADEAQAKVEAVLDTIRQPYPIAFVGQHYRIGEIREADKP